MPTKLQKMFDAAIDEYHEFDRIPEAERRHPRPDVCAFMYLHERLGGEGDIIASAGRDIIYLSHEDWSLKKLTQEDVTYLARCGVGYESEGGLSMFV